MIVAHNQTRTALHCVASPCLASPRLPSSNFDSCRPKYLAISRCQRQLLTSYTRNNSRRTNKVQTRPLTVNKKKPFSCLKGKRRGPNPGKLNKIVNPPPVSIHPNLGLGLRLKLVFTVRSRFNHNQNITFRSREHVLVPIIDTAVSDIDTSINLRLFDATLRLFLHLPLQPPLHMHLPLRLRNPHE